MTVTTVKTPRPTWRRLAVWAVLSLGLGIGFAAASGYVISDFVTVQQEGAENVYLVSVPAEEEMLRSLSAELMQGEESDAITLSDIAPAAGEPLGSLNP